MKKYCVLCARWFGNIKEFNECEVHTPLFGRCSVCLKDLKLEFKKKIRDLKMKKKKVNEALKFHKEVLKKIDTDQ